MTLDHSVKVQILAGQLLNDTPVLPAPKKRASIPEELGPALWRVPDLGQNIVSRTDTEKIVARPMTHANHLILAATLVLVGCAQEKPKPFPQISTYAVGIREPQAIRSSEARVDDDELVIGVRVAKRYRAYLLSALIPPKNFFAEDATPEEMRQLGRHVVNDMLGDIPITVTHCDVNGCTRVFTGEGTDSLDVAVTGTREGQLELSLLRTRFLQNDPSAPLKDHPFSIVPWSKWKAEHPDTDIYIGP